ncbi:DUF2062 domain-containing protein [Agaribacterium haliotis]|uniref:DUF2062 domain-containing protein n=1 Tax=Agaribacterium haliotis TaxID=2013869 RepID=UPI000BB53A11|nr:DUF2062 domain-containing protein [Agaribacterium haliotis]
MPRKLFKRWTPDAKDIHGNPALGFLGNLLHDPNLFHLNRHSVSMAFFIGLFIAFLPIPGQIPLAALAALRLRCNLPLSVLLVWVSNPLTFPIIFYAEYKLGTSILMQPDNQFAFELSWAWFKTTFPLIWQPLLLGAIIASIFFSSAGYLAVQWFWRWHVIDRWKRRKQARNNKR